MNEPHTFLLLTLFVLKEYLKWLILPTFQELGFDQKSNDSHLTILNRGQILDWACRIGISECIDNATALYRSWMNQPESEGYKNTSLFTI